jgi:hypothetical protein
MLQPRTPSPPLCSSRGDEAPYNLPGHEPAKVVIGHLLNRRFAANHYEVRWQTKSDTAFGWN